MISRLSQALTLAALAVLVTTSTGCSSDPCDDVSCSAGEVCEAGECVAAGPNLCQDKTCPTGTGCNPDTGNCMNLCSLPTAPTCAAPETCNPATGTCVNKCAGVECDSNTLTCNPQTGSCEPKCKPTTCPATHACVPETGSCVQRCESPTKPNGQPECAAGLKCKPTTGACVPLCDGVTCGYAQWCEEATGKCVGGQPADGRPGSACEQDTDCGVDNAPAGMEFSCRQSFPEFELDFEDGYCAATCSAATPCPLGSECFGAAGCLDTCTRDADCRAGWRCNPLGGGIAICLPATTCTAENPDDCSPVGGDCRDSGDCITGAECIAEIVERRDDDGRGTGEFGFSGFEDGYCLWTSRTTDTCPTGTVQVQVSQDDPTYAYCMTACDTTKVGQCGFGETCLSLTGSNDGVCWAASCASDRDCNFASCTPTDTEFCGRNQACGDDGFCSMNDKCETNADCPSGLTCGDNGECTGGFCEPSAATCYLAHDSSKASDQLKAAYSQIGLVPSEGSSGWERRCTIDDNCGPNAYCAAVAGQTYGVCERRCSVNIEADLCGDEQVCNESTGQCQDKCKTNAECADGLVCDAGGHCAARCDAAVKPTQCLPTQACDTDSGLCDTRCTRANETTVCGPKGKVCQVSTGMCVPSCHDNAAVCGDDEACSVTTGINDIQIGYCNKECVSDSNCGPAPTGEALTCAGPAGARTCQFKACTAENAATVCGSSQVCVEGACRNKCTLENEALFCGDDQVCDVDAGTCIAKCASTDDCTGADVCNAEGRCVEACSIATEAADCSQGDVCDEASGLCVAACEANDDCDGDLVCKPSGHCDIACTVLTEAVVCGDEFVCEASTGLCVPPCQNRDECGDGFTCDEGGHCIGECTLATQLEVCGANGFCDDSTGLCVGSCTLDEQCGAEVCSVDGTCIARCDAAENATVCVGETACGSQGHCIARCDAVVDPTDCGDFVCGTDGLCGAPRCDATTVTPTDCGAEVCNLDSGLCEACSSDDQCGDGVCEEGLCIASCNADEGATVCDGETACAADGHCIARCDASVDPFDCGEYVCGGNGLCGVARCDATGVTPTACGDQVCNATNGVCEDCESDDQCGAGVCGEAGRCIARCDAEEGATVCSGETVCDVTDGHCVASCNATEDPTDCGEYVCGSDGLCGVARCDATGVTPTTCGAQVCDDVSGLCVPCSFDAQCGGGVCGDAGLCIARCDAPENATDCGDYQCASDGHCSESLRCDATVLPPDACGAEVCNPDSGVCEACTADDQCDGVCEEGLCIAACGTGAGETLCEGDNACGADGHCITRCDALVNPVDCGAFVCGGDGLCTADLRCDAGGAPCNEAEGEVCDATTGTCVQP